MLFPAATSRSAIGIKYYRAFFVGRPTRFSRSSHAFQGQISLYVYKRPFPNVNHRRPFREMQVSRAIFSKNTRIFILTEIPEKIIFRNCSCEIKSDSESKIVRPLEMNRISHSAHSGVDATFPAAPSRRKNDYDRKIKYYQGGKSKTAPFSKKSRRREQKNGDRPAAPKRRTGDLRPRSMMQTSSPGATPGASTRRQSAIGIRSAGSFIPFS